MRDDFTPAEREIIDWCAKVHREVGVTPELRAVMEFYWEHYGDGPRCADHCADTPSR